MAKFQAVNVDALPSEMESPSSGSEGAEGYGKITFRKVAFVALGLAAFAACAVGVVDLAKPAPGGATARQLLESPEVASIVASNLHQVGHQHMGGEEALRRDVAAEARRLANANGGLESLRLTPAEQEAALKSLRLLSDERMIAVGRGIVDAVHDTMKTSKSREDLKAHLARHLAPQLPAMRRLYDEAFPEVLRAPGHKVAGHAAAGSAVDVEQLRAVKAFDAWQSGSLAARRLGATSRVGGAVADQLAALSLILRSRFGEAAVPAMDAARRLQGSIVVGGTTYNDVFSCVMGEMQKMDMASLASCVETAMSMAMDSVQSMFSGASPFGGESR